MQIKDEKDFHVGWPRMSIDHRYLGPLPARSSHHAGLIGKDRFGNFKTGPSAAYPPAICMRFAKLLFQAGIDLVSKNVVHSTPLVGEEQAVDEGAEQDQVHRSEETSTPAPVTPPLSAATVAFQQQALASNGKIRLWQWDHAQQHRQGRLQHNGIQHHAQLQLPSRGLSPRRCCRQGRPMASRLRW